MITASSSAGTAISVRRDGSTGVSRICAAIIALAVDASNTVLPVSSQYATAPSE